MFILGEYLGRVFFFFGSINCKINPKKKKTIDKILNVKIYLDTSLIHLDVTLLYRYIKDSFVTFFFLFFRLVKYIRRNKVVPNINF